MSNIIDKIRLSGTDYTLSATTSGVSVVEVTQAQYDALPSSAKTDTSKMYVITDAEAGDLTNYYTKTETNSAITQATSGKVDATIFNTYSGSVETALSGKQDTLVSGTNIKTINNTSILGSGNIDIQGGGGGGKSVEAGRGISVASGDSAYTVSFNLPVSAGTGTNSLILGYTSSDSYWKSQANGNGSIASGVRCIAATQNSIAVGYMNTASGEAYSYGNFAQGYGTTASGNASHSEGQGTSSTAIASHSEGHNTLASGNYSHSEGENVNATNQCEHSQGRYNVSNKANTTWGDSGNTLFSVGNGTADNARHNAFEIRQNGDIYYFDGTNDVKLQDKFSSIDTTIGDINTILQSI